MYNHEGGNRNCYKTFQIENKLFNSISIICDEALRKGVNIIYFNKEKERNRERDKLLINLTKI